MVAVKQTFFMKANKDIGHGRSQRATHSDTVLLLVHFIIEAEFNWTCCSFHQFNEYFLWEWWAIKLAPVQSVGTYFDGLIQRDICEKTANVKRTHERCFVFDVQVLHELSERKRILDTMFWIFFKNRVQNFKKLLSQFVLCWANHRQNGFKWNIRLVYFREAIHLWMLWTCWSYSIINFVGQHQKELTSSKRRFWSFRSSLAVLSCVSTSPNFSNFSLSRRIFSIFWM